ncbi:MAG TPA: acetyl-CoA carboxylase biotin carboxylase subunit [Vicinamibacterales bacterium]|nr:acetyl-CoA carboxylase biotin carboxylase subunit [Vicinamibacterales bacterium]
MKVLIANRGEIAVRIIRACRELGLGTVAVYSDADRAALHVRLADEAWHIGPSPARDSYLRIDGLLDVARASGATLVHPGYGFLAENEVFAAACVDAGLTFVGPTADAIARMGSKTAARHAAIAAGVQVVPGAVEPYAADAPEAAIVAEAERLGYPIVVKAVAGGGGKGMRTVEAPAELPAAIRAARSEALSAFGDAAIYLERRLIGPRHIEIQLLADHHGTILGFVERECSIQRRHQKVVEESPSPVLPADTRRAMAACAVRVAREVGYTNAGTIEFLVDATGEFFFLEMNTRLQVEHPVTEMVTGVDLVQWQLRIAQGERLTVTPEQALTPRGHAIECRVYAEDPDRQFLPSPGLVRALSTPAGPGVRDDRGVAPGFEIPVFYDSMIAKLVAWGATRADAIDRLARALNEYRVVGVQTTVPFFQWIVRQPEFLEGRFDTTYLDRVLASRQGQPFVDVTDADARDAAMAVALGAWFRAHGASTAGTGDSGGAWRRAARFEGLGGLGS